MSGAEKGGNKFTLNAPNVFTLVLCISLWLLVIVAWGSLVREIVQLNKHDSTWVDPASGQCYYRGSSSEKPCITPDTH